MPYSYCSLPNIQGKGYVAELISDDPDEVAAFIKAWDVPGRGVYHCPNRLVADAPARRIEYVECIEKIFVDIDYRSVEIAPAAIEDKLLQLPVEPSEVISSGRGLHLYWWLKEPVYATDPAMFERARRLHLPHDSAPTQYRLTRQPSCVWWARTILKWKVNQPWFRRRGDRAARGT
jgi:hypothetical protein